MTALSAAEAARPVPDEALPGQLTMPALLALHLVPGIAITVAFVAFAPMAEAVAVPPIAALLAAIVLVLVPIELGVVLWAGRGAPTRLGAVPYRSPIPVRTWAWLVPGLIVAAFLGFGLHQAIEPALIDALFGWLPAWFVTPIDFDSLGAYAPSTWVVTLAAFLAINGFVGPIVEELYFRGYLLPRMARFGRWAPLLNVTLFSIYHFWSPWQIVARILGFGPTVYAVWWRRNVVLGMVVHSTLNVISVVLVASAVLGRL